MLPPNAAHKSLKCTTDVIKCNAPIVQLALAKTAEFLWQTFWIVSDHGTTSMKREFATANMPL